MAQHPPAARRAILRQLKQGIHPGPLLEEALVISEPGHAAAAMLALAADDRIPAKKAAQIVRDSMERMALLDRPGRMAEAWGDALQYATALNRGPETDTAVQRLRAAAARAICEMPNGEWVRDAIIAVAPFVTLEGARALLDRAFHNPRFEVDAAAALLDHHPIIEQVKSEAAPDIAARLLARHADTPDTFQDAIDAAWAIGNMAPRREALRVLVWRLEDVKELERVSTDAKKRDPVDAAVVWTMIAARLDRLGHDATNAFMRASSAVQDLTGRDAVKVHRKLAQAMERAGQTPPPAPEPVAEEIPRMAPDATIPVKPSDRHVLALVDGYTGGFGAPHVRAIARAAPLCKAFDLELVLVGFPAVDEEEVVAMVDAETNVGEGEGYARQLLNDERLHLLPLAHGVPPFWPGTPLATTPHPHPGKAAGLDDVQAPICLLVGLGKQGIPKRMLNVVNHHHELTGKGISMETATAMGILADRLGRVPLKRA